MKIRAASSPKNEITVKSLGELSDNLERLRKLHESGGGNGLTKPLADPALAAIDIQCTAILKFELAKKRGEAE